MGTIKNLNYIAKASYFPCPDTDALLVLEAAYKAAFPTILAATSLGCQDIVRMRAGLSPWHARGMRMGIKAAIPPADAQAVGKVYKYLIPIEKALFFFFVVDLTTGFLAEWQSQIFKLGACGNKPNDCNWTGRNPAWACPGAMIPSTIAYTTEGNPATPCSAVGPGFAVPANYYWQVFFDMTPRPIINSQPIGKVDMWLQRRNPTVWNYPPQTFEPKWYANKVSAAYMMTGQNKTAAYAEYWFMAASDQPATALSGSAKLWASPFPIHNAGIVPVNCFGAPAPSNITPDF